MTRPQEILGRETLWREARDHAVRTLTEQRPEWNAKEFWGQDCPECGETRPTVNVYGFICDCEMSEGARIAQAQIAKRRPEAVAAILSRAGIPPRFAQASFDTFRRRPGTASALDAAQEYADEFSDETTTGLLLGGPWGSGKTHLAVAVLRRCVERTLVEGRFMSCGHLVARVRSGEGVNWRPVDEAISAEFLVLDDLGQEVGTDFTRDVVARVIFGRYDASAPTLFTSNDSPAALGGLFGGGVLSRLKEMTEARTITADDYRGRRAAG